MGKKIKALRSDNGGEYTGHEFEDFCIQHGIHRQLTVPYNPQQNGVAERKNRAIIGPQDLDLLPRLVLHKSFELLEPVKDLILGLQ